MMIVVALESIYKSPLYSISYQICFKLFTLWPGADQSSKAAFGKSAFARIRFAFRQSIFASQKAMVWPSATSKMLSANTC